MARGGKVRFLFKRGDPEGAEVFFMDFLVFIL